MSNQAVTDFHSAAALDATPIAKIVWIVPRILGVAVGAGRPARPKIDVLGWLHNWQSRRDLKGLDARMLRDIGLDEAGRLRECDKPFWVSEITRLGQAQRQENDHGYRQ
ncbi:MAG: DUF1127 domain-containing protein [Alphaproteobacteria bacterium]|nr:DUF1127 domain-containing protein [Alphaproteobacteria bacterium]